MNHELACNVSRWESGVTFNDGEDRQILVKITPLRMRFQSTASAGPCVSESTVVRSSGALPCTSVTVAEPGYPCRAVCRYPFDHHFAGKRAHP